MGAHGRWHGVGMGNACNLHGRRLAMHVAFNSEIPLMIEKAGEVHIAQGTYTYVGRTKQVGKHAHPN